MRPDQLQAIREHIGIARAIPLGPGDAPQLSDALANDAEALLAEVERVKVLEEVVSGLLEIAEMAMPSSYFQTDSRVLSAQAALAQPGVGEKPCG